MGVPRRQGVVAALGRSGGGGGGGGGRGREIERESASLCFLLIWSRFCSFKEKNLSSYICICFVSFLVVFTVDAVLLVLLSFLTRDPVVCKRGKRLMK